MIARLLLTSLLLSVTSPVLADTSVAVLGLRSIEGDDDAANQLTDRLREAARTVEGWSVSPAAVSMAQMSLAHGCEEIDAACLNDIAAGLKADVVIYGTIRRNSARTDYDFAINVNLYDARAREIAKIVDDIMPRAESGDALAARAQKIIGRLGSTGSGGTISIQANAADAEVRVNGQRVGDTRNGALRLGGLQPGQYRIEILKDGFVPHVSTVSVAEGAETSIAAVLSPAGGGATEYTDPTYDEAPGGGHRLGWLGWTLIGLSAASLAGMGVSMAIINDIDNDPQKLRYSAAVFEGNKTAASEAEVFDDVCEAARAGFDYGLEDDIDDDVTKKCNTADTMEVLQWVFLGTAVAAAGTGLYLVLTADDGPGEQVARARTLSFRPRVGREGAGVTASLTF